ncbi:MAG: glycoside hydrolase family 3 C-terminal domain-containing protein [Alistipes sp.]|nr:glycoside hydrolase family 3 C-terminal domain-containing protein [Candidatus Alistipes equi]
MRLCFLLVAALFLETVSAADIYHKGWIDFNKNGRKDIYEDPTKSVEERVNDLISQMTVEEKTCQMVTLYGYRRVLKDQLPTPEWKNMIWKDGMGAIDEHLNSFIGWNKPLTTESPYIWPPSKHAWALNEVQKFFVESTRLGIPVDFTDEGIRGVEAYKSTNFPTQLGLGHTWDKELIYNVGRVTGSEARLMGFTNVYSPILDVGRDQRWGRYEEIYGEDPYLVAELGVQMVKGLQDNYQVASTAKHYAIYSNGKAAREGRVRCDPHETPHEVENIHMYPWREVIARAGLLGAMSSYNDYDGEPIQGSRYWLYDRLRLDFGFKGYVVSDSDAVEYLHLKHHTSSDMKESVRQSVEAGLNVRCTFRTPDSYVIPLRELIQEKKISMDVIDERVKDVLRVKFMVGLFDHPYTSQSDMKRADKEVNGEKNNAIALRASLESIVLLKNDGILPLDASKLKKVAVIGPNANDDHYAHTHYGPQATESVTVFEGISTLLKGKAEVEYERGCDWVDSQWPDSEIYGFTPTEQEKKSVQKAKELAQRSDIAVVVVGGCLRTCGENRSRSSLDLPPVQEYLLKQIKSTGKPFVVILINGRPLSINWADRNANAIVEAWYPGAHGGTAVAKVLFGEYNPGGKLTVTFPKSVGQIPYNFPYKPSSQLDGYAGRGPKGQKTRVAGALYYFGYGLSYTTFEYSNLKLSKDAILPGEELTVSFDLRNTGKMKGDEIVQLYLHDVESSITVYDKLLRGFERVTLEPGETRNVKFTLTEKDFTMLDRNMKRVVEPGLFQVFIGASSEDFRLAGEILMKDPKNPDKVFHSGDYTASKYLPKTLHAGEEITFSLRHPEIPVSKFDIGWRFDTACKYEIQVNEGGGQFRTVKSFKGVPGTHKTSLKEEVRCSDIRVYVTEGTGTLNFFDCEGL